MKGTLSIAISLIDVIADGCGWWPCKYCVQCPSFPLFLNILLGTVITLIFLSRFQGNVVSVTLRWCNKADVGSTDHVASQ